jgi:G3E family GTPase
MKSDREGPAAKARYIMIGGFLGAGKTTAVAQLARHLTDHGLRVGLVTNDQGSELVDTAMLRARGFETEEISGGCFCCRFNSLMEAASKLSASTRPDIFIAEPVGSCTDLVATVSYPLRRIYGADFTIAPLSVLVDPIRALRVLGLLDGARFSDKVRYIYRKQLEEADLIIINKVDLVVGDGLEGLHRALAERFPRAERFQISARNGLGLEPWFERIAAQTQNVHPTMDVDYGLYAEGEALLGWLNATVALRGASPFDGNPLLMRLAELIQERLTSAGAEVAHLKMTLDPQNGFGELAVINLVRQDYVPELSQRLEDLLERGQLIINLRAEANPDILRHAVEGSLVELVGPAGSGSGLTAQLDHLEFFRPGKPQPTHRMAGP